MSLNPLCDTTVIVPEQEAGSSVNELIRVLERKERVTVIQTGLKHGFMNRLSENYSESGRAQFVNYLNLEVGAHPES